ncbi:hypothetical protein GQX36_12690 [Staphylococcus aureus]|nr:hypothetical protein [Staphylococcus aureus]
MMKKERKKKKKKKKEYESKKKKKENEREDGIEGKERSIRERKNNLVSTLIVYFRRLFVDNKSHSRLHMSSNVYHDMMNIIIGYITV